MKPSSTHLPAALLCEIAAPRAVDMAALEKIARVCATDVQQTIEVRRIASEAARGETVLTLHLAAEQAVEPHPVWCLACQLACFCPQARVSVVVHAQSSFPQPPARSDLRSA